MKEKTPNDSNNKTNSKYKIEVPLYGFTKEKVKKELAKIDNSYLKKAMKENYHRVYIYQFYLDDNPYLNYSEWTNISRNLSEKGEAVIVRKLHKEKLHYIPAAIVKKYFNLANKTDELTVEYINRQQEKLTNPNDYQIILNNPEGKP